MLSLAELSGPPHQNEDHTSSHLTPNVIYEIYPRQLPQSETFKISLIYRVWAISRTQKTPEIDSQRYFRSKLIIFLNIDLTNYDNA